MNENLKKDQLSGVLASLGAYCLWGFLPLYWAIVELVPPIEVLAHRILWSMVFMLLLLAALRKMGALKQDTMTVIQQPKRMLALFLASVTITLNWYTYIWAVGNEHVIEASLGYYINPLVSVLFGVIILKERLRFWQAIAVGVAACSVAFLTATLASFPTVAFALAFSFAFYGLFKKIANISAVSSLTLETLMMTPIALIFLQMTHPSLSNMLYIDAGWTSLFLVGAGVVTAVPLLLFGIGARRISLSLIGFLQYIAPTIMLFLGVFQFEEQFSTAHMISFAAIWLSLGLFSFSNTKWLKRLEPRHFHQKQTYEKVS
ncbi:EamA family transporter RarD [Texcoconibacillus texcoconensis]|uniref:Chloramphenicol-sensitive protein RarD n=1 Tax=Texcoconibacillus texcoconensis TaxID=1095777 RepID=A0A840QQR7_9BACI|nr:EamA family transporter RarD [Texcoconibacillus texcoconensis]MBB5173671.1 chloramphenicol-sensitive protein RarD [Texcoconibacillus texcoconensis]